MKAVIYTRVSTAEQARDGVSLEAQAQRCAALAAARGFEVVSTYSDRGMSGRSEPSKRPGLQAALNELQAFADAGVDAALIVYSLSRTTRSERQLWTLLDPANHKSIKLVAATEGMDTSTPMGRAMLGMIGIWAQLEADLVSERTRDALAQIKASGRKLGAPSTAETVPESVERLIALRREGLSHRAIADRLNAEGVKTSRGGKWWCKTVRSTLIAAGVS